MANSNCLEICSTDVIGGSFSRFRHVAAVGSRLAASGSSSDPAFEIHSFGYRCRKPSSGGRLQAVTNLSHLFCCSGVKSAKACSKTCVSFCPSEQQKKHLVQIWQTDSDFKDQAGDTLIPLQETFSLISRDSWFWIPNADHRLLLGLHSHCSQQQTTSSGKGSFKGSSRRKDCCKHWTVGLTCQNAWIVGC